MSSIVIKLFNELPRSKLRGILASSASTFLSPSSVQQAGRFSATKNKNIPNNRDQTVSLAKILEKAFQDYLAKINEIKAYLIKKRNLKEEEKIREEIQRLKS